MISLRIRIWFIPAVLSLACNNEAEPVVQNPPKRDTNIIINELANPYAPVDKSPMDMSYFPPEYPVLKMSNKTTGLPVARIIYSRPVKSGRKIFGNLLKYGQPWRLGANEASEIELFRDVTIQNRKVAAGRYIIYCIPEENNWTIILNSHLFSWGLTPDASKDVDRFIIPVEKTNAPIEYFTMTFEKTPQGAALIMAWDDIVAKLPFQF